MELKFQLNGRDSAFWYTNWFWTFQRMSLKTTQISFINHIQYVFHSSKTQYHKAAYIEIVSIKTDLIPEKEASLTETSAFVETILYLAAY